MDLNAVAPEQNGYYLEPSLVHAAPDQDVCGIDMQRKGDLHWPAAETLSR